MSVTGFFETFPEKMKTDLRTIMFEEVTDGIPVGIFLFMEYYCTDLNCNCQHVSIKVLHAKSSTDKNLREVATIGYTWGDALDDVWRQINADCPDSYLDPFHQQASYAGTLLEFWRYMIEHDSVYVERLKKHHGELCAELSKSERPAARFDLPNFDVPANREERRRLRKSLRGKPVRR